MKVSKISLSIIISLHARFTCSKSTKIKKKTFFSTLRQYFYVIRTTAEKDLNMTYHSTHFDYLLWYLNLCGKKANTFPNKKFIQVSMVGTVTETNQNTCSYNENYLQHKKFS